VHLIKMHVEGPEGLVVKGASKISRQCRPAIMMEFNPSFLENMGTDPLELLRSMVGCGYTIRVIDTRAGSIRPMEAESTLALCRKVGARDLVITRAEHVLPPIPS